MTRAFPWFLVGMVMSTSCAKLGIDLTKPAAEQPSAWGATGIPPQLRAKTSTADDGTPVAAGGNVSHPPALLNLTPEEDIVFTDPDNPEAGLPELSSILAAPKRGPWEESETIAKQRAAREGKPLLIWFTDSARSPMCKALTQELFSNPDFEAWAAEKLVRLRVDAQLRADDPGLSLGEKESRLVELRSYLARMKKTYKVLGYPSLLMLNPSGEVIGRYRGYKRGGADLLWGQLKHGEAVSANAYREWRARLEKKGYREWQDLRQRKVFAKLSAYSNGTLTLIEPDGTRSQTHENRLCEDDRKWIDARKVERSNIKQ